MYNKFYLKEEITDSDKWYVVDRMKDEVLMEEDDIGCRGGTCPKANLRHASESEHREIAGHRMYNGEEGIDAIKQKFERVYGLLEKAYEEDRKSLMGNPNCDQEKFRTYSSEYYNALVHGIR